MHTIAQPIEGSPRTTTGASTYQAWNALQAANLSARLSEACVLHARIARVLDIGRDYLECREWTYLQAQLRKVAPAIAGELMLEALQKEQEWRAREVAGELDPSWDYESMVGQYRRAAIAAATLGVAEPALAVLS
jgi:hypothetical protein